MTRRTNPDTQRAIDAVRAYDRIMANGNPYANQIVLFVAEGVWHAQYTPLNPERRKILDAFGTDTLPTPYMAQMPPQTVLDTIRRRNPGLVVGLR